MALEALTILNGVFSLIYVTISILLGLLIIARYFKFRRKLLILVGITWIGLVSPWYPSTISFLLLIFTGQGLTRELYFLIGNVGAPIILVTWITAFTSFKYQEKKSPIMVVTILYGVAFELVLIISLIVNPDLLGTLSPDYINVEYAFIMMGFAVSIIVVMLVTGILFARESLKSDNPEMKLKGKFLLVAFISYSVGAVMDAAIPLNPITLTIARLILIFAGICWYIGFILPESIKKVFL